MDGNLMHLKKYLGLVKEVITENDLTYLIIQIQTLNWPYSDIH